MRLRVSTFNILNTANKYNLRRPLLIETINQMGADIICLQEVDHRNDQHLDLQENCYLGKYKSFNAWMKEPEGLTIMVSPKIPVFHHERLDLGRGCACQRILINLNGSWAWVVNVHLWHNGPEIRKNQIKRALKWMGKVSQGDAIFWAGDFNGTPDGPTYDLMLANNYSSTYRLYHGSEPDYTFPEDQEALDYVWFKPLTNDIVLEKIGSQLIGDNHIEVGDEFLYPSDHFGLVSEFRLKIDGMSFSSELSFSEILGDTITEEKD